MTELIIERPPVIIGRTDPVPTAREMEQLYPLIDFQPWEPTQEENLVVVELATSGSVVLYPRAIFRYEQYAFTAYYDRDKIELLLGAFHRWQPFLGYVTFTTLKYATGLSYSDMFSLLYNAYVNQDEWLVVRLGMSRGTDGELKYTHLNEFTTRKRYSAKRAAEQAEKGR